MGFFGLCALTSCETFYTGYCYDSYDCGAGEICDYGRCVLVVGCYADHDCGYGGVCDLRYCADSYACTPGWDCISPCMGACVYPADDPCRGLGEKECVYTEGCAPIYTGAGATFDHCESNDCGDASGCTPTPPGPSTCPDGYISVGGKCQKEADPSCVDLDLESCLAQPSCEVIRQQDVCACSDTMGTGCVCTNNYACSGATMRPCEQLDDLECASREDCVTGDGVVAPEGKELTGGSGCRPVTPPDPCEMAALQGGACLGEGGAECAPDRCAAQCESLGEEDCNAASGVCQTYYSGAYCLCDDERRCTCEELTFQVCRAVPAPKG